MPERKDKLNMHYEAIVDSLVVATTATSNINNSNNKREINIFIKRNLQEIRGT